MKRRNQYCVAALAAVGATVAMFCQAPAARATVTTGTGGGGVTVGSSSLFDTVDYSDTFTGTPDGGNPYRPYAAAIQPAQAYVIEDSNGNANRSWQGSLYSFASDGAGNPGLVDGTPTYPGAPVINDNTSGSGSGTGFTQRGGGGDYGFMRYGLRDEYVVQFDAVQMTDRIDITSSDNAGTIAGTNSLSVFFRAGGIGLYNGTTETSTGFTSGVTAGAWNNYAVRFDSANDEIEIFVNEVSRGTVDLTTFASGIYQGFSNESISFGGSGGNRLWTDNVQVGGVGELKRLADGLTSYWNFDEASTGTAAANDLVSGHTGTFTGTASRTTGLVGTGAADFNNIAGDGVNVGSATAGTGDAPGAGDWTFTTGITVEALFATTWDGTTVDEIFRKEDGSNRILLALQNDGFINGAGGSSSLVGTAGVDGISFGLNIGGAYGELDIALDGLDGRPTLATFADGSMHHIVASYDWVTGEKQVWLDGILIGSSSHGAFTQMLAVGSAIAYIGNLNNGSEPFTDTIDEFALYNRALTADEIAQHYHNVQQGFNYFVPEPTTATLLLLAGAGLAGRRRRAV